MYLSFLKKAMLMFIIIISSGGGVVVSMMREGGVVVSMMGELSQGFEWDVRPTHPFENVRNWVSCPPNWVRCPGEMSFAFEWDIRTTHESVTVCVVDRRIRFIYITLVVGIAHVAIVICSRWHKRENLSGLDIVKTKTKLAGYDSMCTVWWQSVFPGL